MVWPENNDGWEFDPEAFRSDLQKRVDAGEDLGNKEGARQHYTGNELTAFVHRVELGQMSDEEFDTALQIYNELFEGTDSGGVTKEELFGEE